MDVASFDRSHGVMISLHVPFASRVHVFLNAALRYPMRGSAFERLVCSRAFPTLRSLSFSVSLNILYRFTQR